jgi:hypothetical protein
MRSATKIGVPPDRRKKGTAVKRFVHPNRSTSLPMRTITPLFLILIYSLAVLTTRADGPALINYQGRVVVGNVNFNGTGQFKFALVNSNGTTTYWSNNGTSTNGNEPTAAVSLTVTNGLYSVLLGDTSLGANMTVIPTTVFAQTDLRLRVWFNDGTHGSQLLSPDQRLAPNAYMASGSVSAVDLADGSVTSSKLATGAVGSTQIANGAVGANQIASGGVSATQIANSTITSGKIASGQVVKTVNGLTDAVTLAAGSNISITPSGNTLTLASTGGSSIWSLNSDGVTANYTGKVGVGQSTGATYRMEITDSSGFDLALFGPSPILKFTDSSASNAMSSIRGAAGGVRIFNNSTGILALESSGNVGVGTTTPGTALEVRTSSGNYGVSQSDGTIRVGTYVGGSASGATGGWFGTISNNSLFFFTNGGGPATSITADSKVHINPVGTTAAPQFEVNGGSTIAEQSIISSGNRAIVTLNSTIGGNNHVYTIESGLFGTAGLFGIYDRTLNKARLTIDATGAVSVPVLSVTGGADVAEPFPIAEKIDKGSVVVIDANHPGRLKRSQKAYDRKVAGIVSGANGIQPGIALHQDGAIEGGENVALSGRVYVQAETSNGFIEPGDLLTTSDVPGCAMKVTDYGRAQGAVIGKAMSALREERGSVLVLVTLQ